MIQFTNNDKEILVFDVPTHVEDFELYPPEYGVESELSLYMKILDEESGFFGDWVEQSLFLPPGLWKILGTITRNWGFSFDPYDEGIIEGFDVPTGGDDYQDYYKNYYPEKDSLDGNFTSPEKSARSLFESNGCYFTNELYESTGICGNMLVLISELIHHPL